MTVSNFVFRLTLRLTLTVGLNLPMVISREAATAPLAVTGVSRKCPAGLLRHRGKTAEQARKPKAHAIFVGKGGYRERNNGADSKRDTCSQRKQRRLESPFSFQYKIFHRRASREELS